MIAVQNDYAEIHDYRANLEFSLKNRLKTAHACTQIPLRYTDW